MNTAEIAATLVKSIGLMALAAAFYGAVYRCRIGDTARNALIGLIFASLALVAMIVPAHLGNGISVDGRTAIVGMAAALGGPIAALIAGATAALYRLFAVGDAGEIYATAGICLAGLIGIAWGRFWPEDRPIRSWELALGGLFISLSLGAVFLAPLPIALAFLLNVAPMVVATNVAAAIVLGMLVERERSLTRSQRRLARDAHTDALTGLPNRRRFERSFHTAAAACGSGNPFSLALIDIDRFKQINDSHGHAAGDEVLAELAGRMTAAVRPTDTVARLGGEEFVILLPETDAETARIVVERVLDSIRGELFYGEGFELRVTASAGLCTVANPSPSMQDFLRQTDTALYAAKAGGRDCLRTHDDGSERQAA